MTALRRGMPWRPGALRERRFFVLKVFPLMLYSMSFVSVSSFLLAECGFAPL